MTTPGNVLICIFPNPVNSCQFAVPGIFFGNRFSRIISLHRIWIAMQFFPGQYRDVVVILNGNFRFFVVKSIYVYTIKHCLLKMNQVHWKQCTLPFFGKYKFGSFIQK